MKQEAAPPRVSRRWRNEFQTVLYDTLRAYQRGELGKTTVTVGQLDYALTEVADRVMAAVPRPVSRSRFRGGHRTRPAWRAGEA